VKALFLLAFGSSALIVYILSPFIIKIALSNGLVDKPDHRKIHQTPLARVGGLAIFTGFIFVLSSLFFLFEINNNFISFSPVFLTVIIFSFSSFLIGLFDDVFSLSPLVRLLFHIIFAFWACSKGLLINSIDFALISNQLDHPILLLPNFLGFLFTVIWLVGVTNAINWIDGLDGLAAGVVSISSVFLFILFASKGQIEFAFMATVLSGCCIGFMPYNFNPSKLLMGDSGSYLLGSLIASMLIVVGSSSSFVTDSSNSNFSFFPTFLLILVPLGDMVLVILKRICTSSSPFLPDKRHLHHVLMESNNSQKLSVIFIYSLTIFFCGTGLKLFNFTYYNIFFVCSCLISASLFLFYFLKSREINSKYKNK